MSTRVLYGGIGVWLAIVAAFSGTGMQAGAAMTGGTVLLPLMVGIVPAAILLTLRRRMAPQTDSEQLRLTDRGF